MYDWLLETSTKKTSETKTSRKRFSHNRKTTTPELTSKKGGKHKITQVRVSFNLEKFRVLI